MRSSSLIKNGQTILAWVVPRPTRVRKTALLVSFYYRNVKWGREVSSHSGPIPHLGNRPRCRAARQRAAFSALTIITQEA